MTSKELARFQANKRKAAIVNALQRAGATAVAVGVANVEHQGRILSANALAQMKAQSERLTGPGYSLRTPVVVNRAEMDRVAIDLLQLSLDEHNHLLRQQARALTANCESNQAMIAELRWALSQMRPKSSTTMVTRDEAGEMVSTTTKYEYADDVQFDPGDLLPLPGME